MFNICNLANNFLKAQMFKKSCVFFDNVVNFVQLFVQSGRQTYLKEPFPYDSFNINSKKVIPIKDILIYDIQIK